MVSLSDIWHHASSLVLGLYSDLVIGYFPRLLGQISSLVWHTYVFEMVLKQVPNSPWERLVFFLTRRSFFCCRSFADTWRTGLWLLWSLDFRVFFWLPKLDAQYKVSIIGTRKKCYGITLKMVPNLCCWFVVLFICIGRHSHSGRMHKG